MAKPDVLYCIEHVARELNVACAVSTIARQRYGLNVHVHVLSGPLDRVFDQHRPQLIALPFCVSRRFVARGIVARYPTVPIVNLACEQLLSRANRRHRLPKDAFARKHVVHAAAGRFFQQWLLGVGVTAENIALVGSMPFQLYRAPYREFFEGRRESFAAAFGLDAQRPWVLLPENFGAAFFSRSQRRKRVRGGYRRGQLREYISYATQSFCQISRWCAEAVRKSDAELIIRPRPAMSQRILTEALQRESGRELHPRLHVIKDGTIQEWILASQLVVSSYSTTLLEAATAGTAARMLMPVPIPSSAASAWHGSVPAVTSQEDFLSLLDDPRRVTPASELCEWAHKNLLECGDAIENVAMLLSQICAGKRRVPVPSARRPIASTLQILRWGMSYPERRLRHVLKPRRQRVFGHECDAIDSAAVQRRMDEWSKRLRHAEPVRAA